VRMMLKTGNRKKAGFTLVEIMVTTVVFSLATVLIYESYFRSLDLVNYCNDYFKVVSWVDERLWQAQNELTRFNTLTEVSTNEVLTLGSKNFRWSLSYSSAGGAPNLYRIDSTLSWQEGTKNVAISRTAYAMYEEKKE
jgi:prepilin-type N-terminal cleavage/methylation domain-containing protein